MRARWLTDLRLRRRATPAGALTMSFQPAGPGQVAPQQSPLARHRPGHLASAAQIGQETWPSPLSRITLSQQRGAVQNFIVSDGLAAGTDSAAAG
jgi:hypothetical protein